VIDGVAEGPGRVARGALRLRVAAADLRPGTPVAISIRPHLIEIGPGGPAAATGPDVNVLGGTVQRASYLGDAVDYQVAVDEGGVVLRAAAAPPSRVRVGERVHLRIAAAACLPLASSSD
jgi:ABC-type Fe3+/spermidine/putrescine transport system ATPase subunit